MLLGSEFHGSKHCCVFLQKILDTGGNIQAIKKIVRAVLLAEPELRLLEPIQHTIINGVNVEPANMAALSCKLQSLSVNAPQKDLVRSK